MDKRAALYQQFDPAKALEADSKLYVDWQDELKDELQRDDLKPRLAASISLSGDEHVTRLLTGHRGVGKTTELKRVQRILEGNPTGRAVGVGRRYFVSFLEAEEWLDLGDVGAPEIVFQIVRQLVDDLRKAGFAVSRSPDLCNSASSSSGLPVPGPSFERFSRHSCPRSISSSTGRS